MAHYNLSITSLAFLVISFGSFAQRDTLDIDEMSVSYKKLGFKKVGLYSGTYEDEYNVRGFTQLDIFSGSLGDYWTSDGRNCIDGKLIESKGEKVLKVKWNKDQDDCDWVGMGFGWDGWVGKDLGYVFDTLAIEMTVRSTGEDFTNIPWAFCMEDYSGVQAWLGYNTSFLKAEKISKEWTKVKIPLSLFPVDEQDLDPTNIKQLLIQTFAEGEIEIQSIQLVPFAGKLKKEVVANKNTIKLDGVLSDWTGPFTSINDNQKFAVSYADDKIYFAFKVKDETPRQNSKTGSLLWDGDAIEVAFSTNPKASDKRKFLMLSDQHLGINCGETPYVWNFKTNEAITDVKLIFGEFDGGYSLELAVPIKLFKNFTPKKGADLDIEVAVDLGNMKSRQEQVRWNSGSQTGFNTSPAMWGVLLLK